MIRIFIAVLVLFAAVVGLDLLGALPIDVLVSWPGGQISPPFRLVLISIFAIVIISIVVWSIFRGVLRIPEVISEFFKARRRDRGYLALSRGMIAAAAGDLRLAHTRAIEAKKLLPDQPLVLLLAAQTATLAGQHDAARLAYEDMTKNDETKLLGLRGLYLEAQRQNASEAARHYASEALKLAPGVPWAGGAMIEFQCAEGDWEGALASLDLNERGKLLEKKVARRLRAVLLTARAQQLELGEPDQARELALQAHRLAPELVPAATIAAQLVARGQDYRRAAKIIETTWKIEPHPELAETYNRLRPGDSTKDRLKRARQLAQIRTHHMEGNLALARAAMEAKEFAEARKCLQNALRLNPTQRVCLMLATLEEQESGDQGRVREWLSRALVAPRDAAWTADGVVSDKWLPASPVTHRLDAFEWRVPVTDEPGHVLNVDELDVLAAPLASIPPARPILQEAPATVESIAAAAGQATATN